MTTCGFLSGEMSNTRNIIISYCQNCNKLSWLWINHCALKTRLDPFVTQLRLLVPFADEGYERRLAGLS